MFLHKAAEEIGEHHKKRHRNDDRHCPGHIHDHFFLLLLFCSLGFRELFSFFLLGETLSLMGLIGAAIILACVVAETLVDTREEKM